MSSCIHKIARGKNKGQLCLKKNAPNSTKCVVHSRSFKKNVTVDTCLCGCTLSTNSIKMLGHAQLCNVCAQQSDIITCSDCNRVGRLEHVRTHFKDVHTRVMSITNTVTPVSEFMAFDTGCVQFPTGTCKYCKFFSVDKNDMISHGKENHMAETSQNILSTTTTTHDNIVCPLHGAYYMMGNFCRVCMTRSVGGHGWNCSLCSGSNISPPEYDFRDHFCSNTTTTVYSCSESIEFTKIDYY